MEVEEVAPVAKVGERRVVSSGFSSKLSGDTSVIEEGDEWRVLTKQRRFRNLEGETRRLAINIETYARRLDTLPDLLRGGYILNYTFLQGVTLQF